MPDGHLRGIECNSLWGLAFPWHVATSSFPMCRYPQACVINVRLIWMLEEGRFAMPLNIRVVPLTHWPFEAWHGTNKTITSKRLGTK